MHFNLATQYIFLALAAVISLKVAVHLVAKMLHILEALIKISAQGRPV